MEDSFDRKTEFRFKSHPNWGDKNSFMTVFVYQV